MSSELWNSNRVILAHFDSYSAALNFARWGETLLLPEGLPAGAAMMDAPAAIEDRHAGEPVRADVLARYGIEDKDLIREDEYDHWVQTDAGPVRIHLLRFKTFEAPHATIEPHGGIFRPISALRGADARELTLVRSVFNLIVGGQKGG